MNTTKPSKRIPTYSTLEAARLVAPPADHQLVKCTPASVCAVSGLRSHFAPFYAYAPMYGMVAINAWNDRLDKQTKRREVLVQGVGDAVAPAPAVEAATRSATRNEGEVRALRFQTAIHGNTWDTARRMWQAGATTRQIAAAIGRTMGATVSLITSRRKIEGATMIRGHKIPA